MGYNGPFVVKQYVPAQICPFFLSFFLSSLRKKGLATLAGRTPELCVQALCPGLVLLQSSSSPAVVLWPLWPALCPPLVLPLSSLAALASPVSSSSPPLVLIFFPLLSSCPPLSCLCAAVRGREQQLLPTNLFGVYACIILFWSFLSFCLSFLPSFRSFRSFLSVFPSILPSFLPSLPPSRPPSLPPSFLPSFLPSLSSSLTFLQQMWIMQAHDVDDLLPEQTALEAGCQSLLDTYFSSHFKCPCKLFRHSQTRMCLLKKFQRRVIGMHLPPTRLSCCLPTKCGVQ